MTLRKYKCTECGSKFYSEDPTITVCQNCSGEGLPDNEAKAKQAEAIEAKKQAALEAKAPQQVNLRELAGKEDAQQIDLKALKGTTPVKRTRKPKATDNG